MQVSVYLPDEDEGGEEANGTKEDEEEVADHEHVGEVEGALEEASHVRVVYVVEDRVDVDKDPRGPEQILVTNNTKETKQK